MEQRKEKRTRGTKENGPTRTLQGELVRWLTDGWESWCVVQTVVGGCPFVTTLGLNGSWLAVGRESWLV